MTLIDKNTWSSRYLPGSVTMFAMGACNLHALRGFGQFVKSFLPFLATIALTYSSKCLYLFLTEGHHTDGYTIFLRMIQSAAFVAPAATLLVQISTCGFVLLIGTCLTILGVTLPLLIVDVHTQEVIFAVLYGSGISIMFQATPRAVSAVFRANIASSAVILSLSAVIMAMSQKLLDKAIAVFPGYVTLGLLVFLSIMCLIPAVLDLLQTRRLHINEKADVDTVWQIQTNSAYEDLEFDTHEVSLPAGESNSAVYNNRGLIWKFCAILWWATGVHLCCFMTSSREMTTNASIIALVCILSLAAFVVKGLLTEGMTACYSEDSSGNNAGYCVLGLLGIGSLVLKLYPHFTDARCYVLLFVISFFCQLKHDAAYTTPKNCNFIGKINQCCIELVFTLCAMIIGYLPAHIIYYKTVPSGLSRLFPDVGLPILATVMILVSVRFSIKGGKSCLTTTTTPEKPTCVTQA